jgi:hypothetical protein
VRAVAAVGGAPAVVVAVSLRGRPGRRVPVGVGWDACGAPVGVVAAVMAASTRGRHMMRLRAPGCRPLGLVRLMSKAGGGEPGALGRGGLGGQIVALMMLSYVGGRR